jgi:hypothetical protein
MVNEYILSLGLTRNEYDSCVYTKGLDTDEWLVVLLYVDDLFTAGSPRMKKEFQERFTKKFRTSGTGPISKYIGVSVEMKEGAIFLHQKKDIQAFLENQHMDQAKGAVTPGDPNHKYVEPKENQQMNQEGYRSVLGSLLWFSIATRPDIAYAIVIASQYASRPCPESWALLKRIMRYLRANMDIGITIRKPNMQITYDADSNHGDAALPDRLSMSAAVFRLGDSTVHWMCRKQRSPAHSSCEAELVSASAATREASWILNMMSVAGVRAPMKLRLDNQSAIAVAKAEGLIRRVKHIEIQDAYVRIATQKGLISIEYVPSEDNSADGMTKAFLSTKTFDRVRRNLLQPLE